MSMPESSLNHPPQPENTTMMGILKGAAALELPQMKDFTISRNALGQTAVSWLQGENRPVLLGEYIAGKAPALVAGEGIPAYRGEEPIRDITDLSVNEVRSVMLANKGGDEKLTLDEPQQDESLEDYLTRQTPHTQVRIVNMLSIVTEVQVGIAAGRLKGFNNHEWQLAQDITP